MAPDRRANNGPLPDDVADLLRDEAEMPEDSSRDWEFGEGIAENQTRAAKLCDKYHIIYHKADHARVTEDAIIVIDEWSDNVFTLEDGTVITRGTFESLEEA